ncbi:hypothetical protein [Shivajiella indica]|uniref:Outer membrane protein beta-barrel domain-containing protein n=1 Tax=Shivajiella indica TaxID=872115 RepID=A0ABW5B4Q4_9BACT
MKNILLICTVFLCLGRGMSIAQESKSHGAEASLGITRGTNKLHDWQASPMQYFTNSNGLKGDYRRITPRNLWYFGFEAGMGEMIAPALGKRQFRFEEGGEPFYLVPTLYQGMLFAQYLRKVSTHSKNTSYLGLKISDSFFYADGLAMNIWTMNLLEFSSNYTFIRKFGERHQIEGNISIPLVASVARMPFSNVVSQPDKSQSRAFLEGAEWEFLGKYVHPEIGIAYQYALSKRNSIRFTYRYQWLSYDQPRSIKMSDHQIGLAYVYKFQFSK